MRALVTGGNGFVGRHLAHVLAARGYEVIIAGRDGDSVDLALDLRDPSNVRDVVKSARAAIVFHLAAQTFVPEATREPLETYDVNALGTARVLEAIRRLSEPYPRVIVASSAEVYGAREPADYPLHERLAPRPTTPYAASKLAVEAIALAWWRTYGIPVIVTRGFNAIGPGQDPRFVVAAFASQLAAIATGATRQLFVGNLTAQRDFLDVRDVAEAYAALADSGEPGEVYNVCSGHAVAIREVLRQLITIAHIAVEVREDPQRMRPSDTPLSYGDPAKIQRATGWRSTRTMAQSLRDAYDDALARRRAA